MPSIIWKEVSRREFLDAMNFIEVHPELDGDDAFRSPQIWKKPGGTITGKSQQIYYDDRPVVDEVYYLPV